MPLPKRGMSDRERVMENIAEDDPYDLNEDADVDAFFDKATICAGWPNPVMIQKDGVPVPREEQQPAKTIGPR